MRIVIRVFSGLFMMTIGVGFCMRGWVAFDDQMLSGFLIVVGVASILMGIFVLVGKRGSKE